MTERDERDIDRVEDDRIDLLLREAESGDGPPDLADQILERHAQGELPPVGSHRAPLRWLRVAAIVVIGASITWAIAAMVTDSRRPDDVPVQGRTIPPPVTVDSVRAVEALPPDTVSVRFEQVLPQAFSRLPRLRKLRYLEVTGAARNKASDEDLVHLVDLQELEVLILNGLSIRGHTLDRLAVIPNLRRLDLRQTKLDPQGMAALARLQSLNHVDVADIEKFDDACCAPLLTMEGLRHLDLGGNGLIGEGMLLKLGTLRQLRHLGLSHIRGSTVLEAAGATVQITATTGDGVGVDDRVLRMIGNELADIESLDLSGCVNVTGNGLRELLANERLHSLDLTRTRLGNLDLQPILKRGGWRMLGLPLAATWSDAQPLPLLALLPAHSANLVELRLDGTPSLPVDLSAVCKLSELRVLELDEAAVDPASLTHFGDLDQLEVLRVRKWPEILFHLPTTMKRLREVELIEIFPDSGDYLRRLKSLESLEVIHLRGCKIDADDRGDFAPRVQIRR